MKLGTYRFGRRDLLFGLLLVLGSILFPAASSAQFSDPVSLAIVSVALTAASMTLSAIANARARKPAASGQAVQDIKILTSRAGEPVTRIYGYCGTGVQVIYRGDPISRWETRTGGGKRRQEQVQVDYSTSLGVLVCENQGHIKGVRRIWMDNELVYSFNSYPGHNLDGTNPPVIGALNGPWSVAGGARRFQILLGLEDQEPCSWYEYYMGGFTVGQVPAYKGYLTLWWDDLNITRWYNKIPTIVVEVETSATTIFHVFKYEAERVGLVPSADYNGFGASDITGLVFNSFQSPREVIEVLQHLQDFDVAEYDGKIRSRGRNTTVNFTVSADDLAPIEGGAEDGSKEIVPRVEAVIDQPIELPSRVEVTYMDAVSSVYEQETAGWSRFLYNNEIIEQIYIPGPLTKEKAEEIALKRLLRLWRERSRVKLSLPPKYFQVAPGDGIQFPLANGATALVRATNIDVAPNGVLRVEGRLTVLPTIGSGGDPSQTVNPPPPFPDDSDLPVIPTVLVLSNAPPAIDADDDTDGIYAAVCPEFEYSPEYQQWRGATLHRNACGSDDANLAYQLLASFTHPAVIGIALNALPEATGLDEESELVVDFPYGYGRGRLQSIHNDAFTKTTTANLALLQSANGDEWLQFRDVEPVEGFPTRYRLTTFKRGVRDTESKVGGHDIGDKFILYDPLAVLRIELNQNEQDNTWNFKAPTIGQSIDEVIPVTHSYILEY